MRAILFVRLDEGGRDNNLNLLRILAAFAVMVSHAWPIVYGPGTPEPLQSMTGYSLGTIAVMIFFGLSGFLIVASWDRRRDPAVFLASRARRLLPGLWVMLLFTVLILGPSFGVLTTARYFEDPETWRFLALNAAIMPVVPELPGVFVDNPYPAAAGSIWTLHYEMLCYLIALFAGMAGLLTRRGTFSLLVLISIAAGIAAALGGGMPGRLQNLLLLGLPFAMGAAAWAWRDAMLIGLPGVLTLVTGAWIFSDTAMFQILFTASVVSGALWLGFVPCSLARWYNRAGDFSYGAYLYAFPVQGAVQQLFMPSTPIGHLVLAIGPVLVLAVLSWQFVEKPWLHRRGRVPTRRLRRRFSTRNGNAAVKAGEIGRR